MNNESEKREDPTRMANQPALRTSSGKIWLIMGGLFVIANLIPLGALIFVRQGPSAPLATVLMVGIIVLYAAMIGARLFIARKELRLRFMAGCMLAIAATAVFGMVACAWLEQSAALG